MIRSLVVAVVLAGLLTGVALGVAIARLLPSIFGPVPF